MASRRIEHLRASHSSYIFNRRRLSQFHVCCAECGLWAVLSYNASNEQSVYGEAIEMSVEHRDRETGSAS